MPRGRTGTAISVGGGEVRRAPSKHLAGHKETPYDYVRMLYRGMDQGVTATSESHEERVARSKQCKTTGWQPVLLSHTVLWARRILTCPRKRANLVAATAELRSGLLVA